MIGIYSGALSRRRESALFSQARRCCVQMLKPFIYLTSFSVMFFLTEFALHTHLNAFGARTMTALYAAAMFINGCGYLLFPLLARTRMAAADKNRFVPATAALFVISAALAEIFTQPGPRILFSFAAMALGGFIGGASLWAAAAALRPTGMTGKLYAAAIAASVAVQYPIQNYFAAPHLRLAVVAAAAALFVRAMPPSPGEPARRLPPEKRGTPAADFIFAAAMVVLLSYFYSLGDGVLMKLNAEGKLTVFKWPRLFYILSLMIAGWAADLRSGRVIAFAALAAAAVTGFYPFFLAGDAESYQLFHLCFWCFAGFYVVCFSVPFMRTAEESAFPELWACLGRIIKQFVNCAGVVFASALTEVSGARWIFWCNAALVAAMAAWLAFGRRIGVGETYAQDTEDEAPAAPQATEDERIAAFAGKYGLSARETEILKMLADRNAEQTTQELADALGVSRRTCERRLSALYAKTGVRNRADLMIAYVRETR